MAERTREAPPKAAAEPAQPLAVREPEPLVEERVQGADSAYARRPSVASAQGADDESHARHATYLLTHPDATGRRHDTRRSKAAGRLQRAYGNRLVQRLLSTSAVPSRPTNEQARP